MTNNHAEPIAELRDEARLHSGSNTAEELCDLLNRAADALATAMSESGEAVAWQKREDGALDGTFWSWETISRKEFDRLALIFAGRETVRLAARRYDDSTLVERPDGWPSQIRALYASPPAKHAASEHVRKLVGKLDQWRLCLSHNESYVGEPAGLFKEAIRELAQAVDPIYPEPKNSNPFERVVIYTSETNEQFNERISREDGVRDD